MKNRGAFNPEMLLTARNHKSFSQTQVAAKCKISQALYSKIKGTFHKLSPKHLDRYVQEFAGRHNIRNSDTLDQMAAVMHGMEQKRLRYRELIADNGLDSGARV